MPKGYVPKNAAAYELSGSAAERPKGAQALFGLKVLMTSAPEVESSRDFSPATSSGVM